MASAFENILHKRPGVYGIRLHIWQKTLKIFSLPIGAGGVLTTMCQGGVYEPWILEMRALNKSSLQMNFTHFNIREYASQASTSAYRALINVHALAKLLARVHDALQPCLALPVPLMQDMSTIEK